MGGGILGAIYLLSHTVDPWSPATSISILVIVGFELWDDKVRSEHAILISN